MDEWTVYVRRLCAEYPAVSVFPALLACVLWLGLVVGCAGGDDGGQAGGVVSAAGSQTIATPDTAEKAAADPTRADRRSAAGPDKRERARTSSRRAKELLALLRNSDVQEGKRTTRRAVTPRALLKALRGTRDAGRSAGGRNSGEPGMAEEVEKLLNGGGASN